MRTKNLRVIALAGVAALAAMIGSAFAAEGDAAASAPSGGEAAFIDRLLDLEAARPELLPTAVEDAETSDDPRLIGSFTSARSTFDDIEDELRQLFVDSESVRTEVAMAVNTVTFGLLLEHQALEILEQAQDSTNPRPLDSSDLRDDDGVAIDADGLEGQRTIGINLLLDARAVQLAGYRVLGDPDVAGVDQFQFEVRLLELEAYADVVEPDLIAAAGRQYEQMLVPVTRYDAPLGVGYAVGVSYVCVDREAYLLLADASDAERIAGSLAETPDPDCEAAARRAGLELEQQVAADPSLDGVKTAVSGG